MDRLMEISIVKQEDVNIRYKNKSLFDLVIRVKQSTGAVYTLTDKSIRMDIKANRDDQTFLYRLVSGTEITISDVNLLTFNKVMELPNDTYHYDLKIVTDNYFIMGGLIKVLRNVTG